MSAFLGPIHHWLYNKIQLQNKIVEDVLSLAKEDYDLNYREDLINKYGAVESGPLEEAIDETNIHGWLQDQIHIVENHLAYLVTNLLKEQPKAFEKIKEVYRNLGIKQAGDSMLSDKSTASEIYKAAINDSLLDGMPCDHVNSVNSQDENVITWKRNLCVHEEFWNDVDGDVSNYYVFREEYINGFLESLGATYEKVDASSYKISK